MVRFRCSAKVFREQMDSWMEAPSIKTAIKCSGRQLSYSNLTNSPFAVMGGQIHLPTAYQSPGDGPNRDRHQTVYLVSGVRPD